MDRPVFDGNTRNNLDIAKFVYKHFICNPTPRCSRALSGFECKYAPSEKTSKGAVGCAVGVLLPEEVAIEWDSKNFGPIEEVNSGDYSKYFDDNQREFLSDLQHVHDYYKTMGSRKQAFSMLLAKYEFNLDIMLDQRWKETEINKEDFDIFV